MRMSVAGRWLAMSCLVLLAACGGGGGGGSSALSMSFAPSTVTGSVQQGEVGTLTTTATVNNADKITGQVIVDVEDGQHVLTGIDVAGIDEAHFSVTLHTSQTLSMGHHRGTFAIHLCKDQQCSQEWMGATSLAYDIDVEAAPMQALPTTATESTVAWQGVDTDSVGISITGGTQWTASSGAAWLVPSGPATGASPAVVAFTFAPGQLAEGDYTTTITITDSPSGQSVGIPVTLHVIAPAFVIDAGGSPVFTAVNGAPIDPQPFAFELSNGVGTPWTLDSSATWLEASATSGITPANLTLTADPSIGALAAGGYDGLLTLSSTGVQDKAVSAHLQLIKPTLSLSVPSVTLGGDRGRDLTTPQTVQLSLNTGSNAYAVSMSTPPSGVTITPGQSTVNQAGTTLTLALDPANVTIGSSSQAVTFTSQINGDTVTSPLTVNMNVDQRRLLPSSWGVGFASTPLGSVTTRTLHVKDAYGASIPWTATSDSAWLSATSGGMTPAGDLVLTADPTKAPSDVVSVAHVRIASPVVGVVSNDISVAIWKSATAPTSITTLPGNTTREIVADKIRPYVYTHSGGSTITIYNAYTAAPVKTISTLGTALGQMAISPDGNRLYAIDTGTQTIQVVYLDLMAWGDQWPVTGSVDYNTPLVAVRPDGYEVVIVGNGTAYAARQALPSPGIYALGHMSATDDGTKLYTIDSGYSPASLSVWTLDHSDISGGVLYATNVGAPFFVGSQSNGRDIAVAPDGSAVYSASGAPYACVAMNPNDLSFLNYLPGGDAYPNNVEVTWDNRAICGIDGAYETSDIWVYTPAGAIKSTYKVAGYAQGLLAHGMVVTPDGLIVVVPTSDPLLAFIPIGP